MGRMTFEQMQIELSLNLAGVAPSPDRLKQWVNFAIIDLATEYQFDELRTTDDFSISDGVTEYNEPSNLLGIVDIKVDEKSLRRMRRLWSEAEEPAQPLYYMRKDGKIVVWPEPDDDYDGYIEYMRIPDNLESASEVSPFAAHWDLIIVQRATYHGLFALGKVQEADVWLIRSRQIQDRKLKEEDISKEVPHEGLRVAWSFDDLVDNPPHVGT